MQTRILRRLVGVLTIAVAVFAWAAAPAGAHVTVQPATVEAGGFGIFSFSVPNESETANTVGLEVELPANKPLTSVRVQPMAGWDASIERDGADGPVTRIIWTATDGGLAPDEFDLFTVSAGPFPKKAGKLVFNALQTYSDGEVVRWIEPQAKGAPEPDFPAPVLKVVKPANGTGHGH